MGQCGPGCSAVAPTTRALKLLSCLGCLKEYDGVVIQIALTLVLLLGSGLMIGAQTGDVGGPWLVAVAASYLPSRRATRVSPIEARRSM